MAKAKTMFTCNECGHTTPKWLGQCPDCGAWNSYEEGFTRPSSNPSGPMGEQPKQIAEVATLPVSAQPSGVQELDRVLGGGFVAGSVALLGGEPGIGKSTLLLQTAAEIARSGQRCFYVTAEESSEQVRIRAERLGAVVDNLWLVSETSLPAILGHCEKVQPDVLIVDSIQTIADPEVGSAPGAVAQVRHCANVLVGEAKRRRMVTVLVGHVTKEGGLAGPRALEHVVDTVLSFEGDRHHALRLLRAVKHRFGATDELGVFEMTSKGLDPVADPSKLFLTDRVAGVPGSVVVPVLDGHRPLLIEIQALVAPTALPAPRRSAHGVDSNRLALTLAILERRAGLFFGKSDVYASAVGGTKISEPAVDLGVALALASSIMDKPLPSDLVAFGEVGLAGELRQASQSERRLVEAARVGFARAIIPAGSPTPGEGVEVVRAQSLEDALRACGLLGVPSPTGVGPNDRDAPVSRRTEEPSTVR